ncbi:MAG: tetratricopeptide repeat protein [Verrucomicrobiota bacterium]
MIDGRTIKIRTIHESYETWLCLEGTILSYNERIWADWGMVSIPIELIDISESKRFNGRRLIAAFLSLLLGWGVGGIFLALLSLVPDPEIKERYWGWIFGGCVLLGFCCFFVFLIGSFIRQRTIILRVAPQNSEIDFWVQRRNSADLNCLMEAIRHRKPMVNELMGELINHPIGEVLVQPWKKTAGLVFLFSIPAMTLEITWMLLLGLIPLVLHVCSLFSNRKQPVAFRKAKKFYLKGDRRQALEAVSKAVGDYPGFVPAWLLKIRLLIGLENFQEAQSVLDETGRLLDWDTAEQVRKEIMVANGISLRKKWREPT